MRWSQPGFENLARLVAQRTGLDFGPDRQAGVELGISRVVSRLGLSSPDEYLQRLGLNQDPRALDDLITELTIGETYFFREPDQFRFLREVVLPEIRERKDPRHILRAWSAGCASGEEAYSMAIVFREEWPAGRAHLMATDLSRAALARAWRGRYSEWSLRGEGANLARPYLRDEGKFHVVEEDVRRMVAPSYLNLARGLYPSTTSGIWGMDIIFCRNVLIYLDRKTIGDVARKLHASLADGGWLIMASSDPSLLDHAAFEPVMTEHGLFYRRELASGRRSTAGESPPVLASSPSLDQTDQWAEVHQAMASGDYAGAADRTLTLPGEAAQLVRVRALANLDPGQAERASAQATASHPLSDELHHLRAIVLLNLGRVADAAEAARRAVCLDRVSIMAHFTLGSILARMGDRSGAWRAYRNAWDLAVAQPPDAPVRLSDDQTAGRLALAAELEMARLGPIAGEVR